MSTKNILKKVICSAILLGVSSAVLPAFAEEQKEFTLEPVMVTAMRVEKKEIETPAAVHVYTEEELKQTGSDNLLDALSFTEGLFYDGYGPQGHLYSTMGSKIAIRGMERGTVILINGVPTNMSGYYALERIPLDNIEKVEIVKGAASTLYGSSAMGGVINIVTKKHVNNSIFVQGGSYDSHKIGLSLQLDDLSISASHGKRGDMGQISDPYNKKYTAPRGDKRDFLRWSWKLNDNLTLTHQHDVDDFDVDRMNDTHTLDEQIAQKETKDSVVLQWKTEHWQSNFYGNWLGREYKKYKNSAINTNTDTKYASYGVDSQTEWKTAFGQYIGGFTWHMETLSADDFYNLPSNSSYSGVSRKSRDFYSFFGQVTHPVSEKTDLILGARQEFIDQKDAQDYSKFLPQVQMITRITPEHSWYANIGKAFRMPGLSDMYGSTWRKTANPNLEPEYGYSYETGWKWIESDHSLKVALYHLDYTNYIRWTNIGTTADPNYVPYNTEFRNTGIEVSYDKKLSDVWKYNLGLNLSNPEEKAEGKDWASSYGKVQITGGVGYHQDKWTANLKGTYLSSRNNDLGPCFPINFAVGYQVSDKTHLQLNVANLFDRNDIISHGTSHYYAPRTYQVKMTQNF